MTTRHCLYALRLDESGPIKIGITRDLRKRISTLRTSVPSGSLEPVAVAYGDGDDIAHAESAIHRGLRPYRVRGEWFHPSSTVLSVTRNDEALAAYALAVAAVRLLGREAEEARYLGAISEAMSATERKAVA